MATTKNREVQAKLARLKRLGLYSGNARKRPTKYGKTQVKKYSDVLSGDAAVISAPSYKTARSYKVDGGMFRVKRNKIIVRKKKGERFKFEVTDRKTGAGRVVSYRKAYDKTIKKVVLPGIPENANEILPHKNGKKYRYVVPFGSGPNAYTHSEERWEDMVKFMTPYEQKSVNPYLEWQKFVFIEEYSDSDEDTDDIE